MGTLSFEAARISESVGILISLVGVTLPGEEKAEEDKEVFLQNRSFKTI